MIMCRMSYFSQICLVHVCGCNKDLIGFECMLKVVLKWFVSNNLFILEIKNESLQGQI